MIDYYDDCNESQNEREKGNERDKDICFRSSALGLAIFFRTLKSTTGGKTQRRELDMASGIFLGIPKSRELHMENLTVSY